MLDRRPPLPSAAGDNLVVLRAASRAEPSQGRLQLSFTEGVVVDRCGRLPQTLAAMAWARLRH